MMANMSYCRFQNTLQDLRACRDALSVMNDYKSELGKEESSAADRLLLLCRELADDYTEMADD